MAGFNIALIAIIGFWIIVNIGLLYKKKKFDLKNAITSLITILTVATGIDLLLSALLSKELQLINHRFGINDFWNSFDTMGF